MAHWVPTARWVRHPRLRRGAKVSPFICRASRRRSITSLTLIQWVPGWSLGRLPLQLFALHASCRRSVLRDRGQRSILIVRWRRGVLRPPDAARSSVERVLVVLFVPSVERDGVTAVDQLRWVNAALEMFGRVFGGATAYPKAQGIWRDDERGGALVKDEPVVVHCYTTPADIEDARNLAELGDFCRRMGRDARQGEVGLVVGNEYFAIRDFAEE